MSLCDYLKMEVCTKPEEPDGGALGQGHVRVQFHGRQSYGEAVNYLRQGLGTPQRTPPSYGTTRHITA